MGVLMSLARLLLSAANSQPDGLGVICQGHRFTYSQILERVFTQANELITMGVGVGERVAIVHKNCHRFLEAYYAVSAIGAVLVPVNHRLTGSDLAYIINDSGAEVLITQNDFADLVGEAMPGVKHELKTIWTSSDDVQCKVINGLSGTLAERGYANLAGMSLPRDSPAQIYYTSGTTGKPKGVVLSHENNLAHADSVVKEIELDSLDHWLHISPMFHLADAWAVWAMTSVGGVHVMVDEFDEAAVLEIVEETGVTLTNFIPTMLNLLVKYPDVSKYDLDSFRLVMSGGAPIAPEVVRSVMDTFGCRFVQTYGMTETSPFLTMSILTDELENLPDEQRFGFIASTGRVFLGVDLRVIRDDGGDVEPDNTEVGEIIVRGPTITNRYWNLPEETRERIVDGWLHTGDLATIGPEGYVNIVDRKGDMIITGGENVYSIEVENILYQHPAVLEAAAVGLPDEKWDERIVGVVVPKKDTVLNEVELIEFCKRNLAGFKIPKQIVFLDELPKTGSGKISKQKLRQMVSD
jgi:acyl-CoA synthetase (AMP-forming)/AMP-acid ligase II